MDISITVPRGKQVIANGRRIARTVHGGNATTRWRADEPMVPYLAFFAAGSYAVDHGRRHGLPWYVAVSKQLPARHAARVDAADAADADAGRLAGDAARRTTPSRRPAG